MTFQSNSYERAIVSVLLAGLALASQSARANDARTLGEAAYEVQHYAAALAAFERAGSAGDLRAQEMAGLMHLYGSTLYGAQVPRDAKRAEDWLARAALQGSEVARCVLGQRWARSRQAQ